jgi:hypothetical protein
VNLKNYQDDIVLHVNPRFDDNALVLNSGAYRFSSISNRLFLTLAQRGSWATEERHGLPIQRGARFTMVIMATDHSFKVDCIDRIACFFRTVLLRLR